MAKHQLHGLQEAESTAEQGMRELRLKQEQLVGLVRTLDLTRDQLTGQLLQINHLIEGERQMYLQASKGPLAVQAHIEELHAESERLRRTIASVSEDQDELSRIANEGLQEVQRLRLQSSQLLTARSDMQWTLDRLRHTADMQEGELTSQGRESKLVAEKVEVLEAEVRSVRSEFQERQRDMSLGMNDLLHMTRENQLLHDDLIKAQQQSTALTTASQEQRALVVPRLQALRGTELQREQAVRAYQQALDERQRNEAAIAEIASQVKCSRLETVSLESRLANIRSSQEGLGEQARHGNAEILALRAKLSGCARSLELSELAREKARAERTRLCHTLGLQQAAAGTACLGTAAADAELDALRGSTAALERELKEARLALTTTRQEAERGAWQQARLREAVAQQRRAQQQLEVERARLGRLLETSGERAAAGVADGGGAAESDDAVEGLRRTLDQQSVLLSQMTAERQDLAAEIQRLRDELAARNAGLGSSPPTAQGRNW